MQELCDFPEGVSFEIVQAYNRPILFRQLHDRVKQLPVLRLCEQDCLIQRDGLMAPGGAEDIFAVIDGDFCKKGAFLPE